VCVYLVVFQYDPGFQEDPSQPFSDSDEDINDTDGQFTAFSYNTETLFLVES